MIEPKFIELELQGTNNEYTKTIINVDSIIAVCINDVSNDNTTTIVFNFRDNVSLKCKYSYEEMTAILDKFTHVYKPLENMHIHDKTE